MLARHTLPPAKLRQDRALAPAPEEPHFAQALLFAGDLKALIKCFVDHYNHQRNHESRNKVMALDVYFGRYKAIRQQRERIQWKTLEAWRLHHKQLAA